GAGECAGVVDQGIGLGAFRGERVYALAVGEIERKAARGNIVLGGDLGLGRIEIGRGARHQHDIAAFLGQYLGAGAADTARRTGDERLASPQPQFHRVLPAEVAGILPDFDPGQLVLVVKEMAQLRARDGGKAAGGLMIRLALELDRADETAAGAGGEPALDERQEAGRIAYDIRKEPVAPPDLARVERERALQPGPDPRKECDPGA